MDLLVNKQRPNVAQLLQKVFWSVDDLHNWLEAWREFSSSGRAFLEKLALLVNYHCEELPLAAF